MFQRLNIAKPSRCPTAEHAVDSMRLCAQDHWTNLELLQATLRQAESGSLPTSTGSDTLWAAEMIQLRNMMGHLRAIIAIHRRRATEQHTSAELGTLPTPLLMCGGPPRDNRSISETPIERSLRAGLNPSNTVSTTIRAEAYEAGPAYLHFPPLNHNLEFRLEGLWNRSLSPQSTGNGGAAQSRRSSLGAIVAFPQEASSQNNLASSAVSEQTLEHTGVTTTTVVMHRLPVASPPVSRVMEAARTGTSPHPSDLAPGGNSETLSGGQRSFSGGPGRPGRGPAYGENSASEGFRRARGELLQAVGAPMPDSGRPTGSRSLHADASRL